MKYNAARGGHAPGHIREAFLECMDGGDAKKWYEKLGEENTLFFYKASAQQKWQAMSLADRGRWITGQLWNCTDTLPGDVCQWLDLPQGSSYSNAARMVRSGVN